MGIGQNSQNGIVEVLRGSDTAAALAKGEAVPVSRTRQPFTDRQQVILDRLVTLGQWLAEEKLPVRVLGAYGFGSFFRGKDRPHDVDILLRRSMEETDHFRLFSNLLDKACCDRAFRSFKTPQAALLHAFDQHYTNLIPGLIDVGAQRNLFAQWIEGYTWNMLSRSDIVRELKLRSPTEIARRFVKRNLPNVNIAWWIGPDESPEKCGLRAAFVVLFWSKDNTDVQANVEHALLDSQRHKLILAELVEFDRDFFRIETQIDRVKEAIKRLFRTPKSRKFADTEEWLEAWIKRQKGLNVEALVLAVSWDDLTSQQRLIEQLGLEYPEPSYHGWSVGQLSELVEEKRSRLKQLRYYLKISQEMVQVLAFYKSTQRGSAPTVRDFLVTHFLHDKSQDWWKKGQPILADLGLDVSQRRIDTYWKQFGSRRRLKVIGFLDDDEGNDGGDG